MRSTRVTLALTLALPILGGLAPGVAQPPPDSPLAPLAFLVGRWELRAAGAPSTAPPAEHLAWSWEAGGQALGLSRLRSDDGARWRVTALAAWNPASGRIEIQQLDDGGGFGRGSVELGDEGRLAITLEVARAGGREGRRATLRRTGDATFEVVREHAVEGGWKVEATLRARRVSRFPWEASAVGRPGGFPTDDAAMARFAPHLGIWAPAPGGEDTGARLVVAWGLPGKTVHSAEYRTVDGALVQANEALMGYHYGRQRIEFLEFARDGLVPFEVMNQGTVDFLDDGTLVRRYRSFDPDMSSREYREQTVLLPDGTRELTIAYRDDEGLWKPFPRGPFRYARVPELLPGPGGD